MQYCPMNRNSKPIIHWRAWTWALGLSLLGHGLLFLPLRQAQSVRQAQVGLLPAMQTRNLSPQPMLAAQAHKLPADHAGQPQAAAIEAMGQPTGAQALPVAIAPAAEWLYQLRQNGQSGQARLSWQPQDGGYHLKLERQLAGLPLPGWRSEGRFDEQGLAPGRFAQQRGGRDAQATNFRRDEGLISFSSSQALLTMPGGVQDRISWWLQLAAIVAGDPQRFSPGSEIILPVAGLRGELRDWVFTVTGFEPLQLAADSSNHLVLRLQRRALGAYDGDLSVWLDPGRAYLPVRLQLQLPDERGWEMQLLSDQVNP